MSDLIVSPQAIQWFMSLARLYRGGIIWFPRREITGSLGASNQEAADGIVVAEQDGGMALVVCCSVAAQGGASDVLGLHRVASWAG